MVERVLTVNKGHFNTSGHRQQILPFPGDDRTQNTEANIKKVYMLLATSHISTSLSPIKRT